MTNKLEKIDLKTQQPPDFRKFEFENFIEFEVNDSISECIPKITKEFKKQNCYQTEQQKTKIEYLQKKIKSLFRMYFFLLQPKFSMLRLFFEQINILCP